MGEAADNVFPIGEANLSAVSCDGVLAELHTPVGVEDMAFFVSGGRVTSYLHPTVSRDGRLAWEPLAVEISVNTDDAIPAVRGPLRDALLQGPEWPPSGPSPKGP